LTSSRLTVHFALIAFGLLWLAGIALRLAILAVPPVIPALRTEFHLSGTDIGILSGLPIVVFAAAALAGSRLIARIGVVPAAVVGLLFAAVGSAARAWASGPQSLFATTAVMGIGVGLTQPAMPALVGRWLPDRIGLGTGIYTNGLLVGEILPVGLFPVLFPLLGSSWRASFVFWGVPIAVIALLVLLLAPRERGPAVAPTRGWWPDWPARELWRLGLIFVGSSSLYFATNAFLPGRLAEAGRPELISPALTALNLGQLPASLLLIAFGRRIEGRAWPFVVAGTLGLTSLVAIMTTVGATTVASAATLGFAAGAIFALGLTLPPLLSAPSEVAAVSAAIFTIGYAGTVVIVVICGATWDLVGAPRYAFAPIIAAVLATMILAPTIRFPRVEQHTHNH
jgi:CP family cyanate transporter-like MFS transporter